MSDCIFCKIINKEIPSEFLYEDDLIIVIKDINPKAKVHLLVISKSHIENLKHIDNSHKDLVFHIITKLNEIAESQNLKGFRTIVNTGREGGQEVDHLHFHILGGNDKLVGF